MTLVFRKHEKLPASIELTIELYGLKRFKELKNWSQEMKTFKKQGQALKNQAL